MNLIMSDRPLCLGSIGKDTRFVDLSQARIANCVGCFGCWIRTPGRCVIRDDAVSIYPLVAQSERVLYVSRVKFGGYDTPMKTMIERSIPTQQAFIRLFDGETHHFQRAVAPKRATVIGYGAASEAEEAVFRRLVDRNARNMNFSDVSVLFATEDDVDQAVRKEIESWVAL